MPAFFRFGDGNSLVSDYLCALFLVRNAAGPYGALDSELRWVKLNESAKLNVLEDIGVQVGEDAGEHEAPVLHHFIQVVF